MAKKGFGSFGNQNPKTNTSFNRFKFDSGSNYQVKPIKAEFGSDRDWETTCAPGV